jgi:hypothetical protein
MKFSPLGFSLIRGDRFYGIGNEYMGILLSASLLSAGLLHQIKKEKTNFFIFIFLLFSFLVISLPRFGANVGGAITSFFSFAILLILLQKKKINIKKLLVIILLFALFFLVLLLSDVFLSKNSSHLGFLFRDKTSSNFLTAFTEIIFRKIIANLSLLQYTRWNTIFIPSSLLLIFLFFHPKGIVKKFSSNFFSVYKSLLSIALAGSIGFFVNDSGVIILAISSICISSVLLYFSYEQI